MRTIDTLTPVECRQLFTLAFGREPDSAFASLNLPAYLVLLPAQTTITDSRLALHLCGDGSLSAQPCTGVATALFSFTFNEGAVKSQLARWHVAPFAYLFVPSAPTLF